MRHLGLEAILAMAALSLRPRNQPTGAVPPARRPQTEVEAWNEAVEKRKAEKKSRKLKKDHA